MGGKEEGNKEEPSSVLSKREVFDISGPLHLTQIDWTNLDHRRSVAASLVQGVCVLERDRQQKRYGPEAQATPWWTFFNFQLVNLLLDDNDKSIFGAIFEYKKPTTTTTAIPDPPPDGGNKNRQISGALVPPGFHQHAPIYTIAFRGTLNKRDSISRDIELDLLCIRHKLHKSSRFRVAVQAVHDLIAIVGSDNLWLAGHSLGSAIAILAGKKLAKGGTFIETYLFNPPFLSAPIERINNKTLKQGIRFTSGVVKAGLAATTETQDRKTRKESEFAVLATWMPYMFLNPSDHICAGYIGYFEHRRRMEERGAGKIERIALSNSVAGLLSGSYSEPLHLVPSAYLTVNSSNLASFKKAHGIHQWWNPDNCFCSAAFKFVNNT
ncbi:unnamed protein product [Linum tenue]|uniref:Uncharacterized protein n=1 Tax=Linum tenue TaxID=586396 RepID=A0AAV0QBN6_9ROSI|nr:unnamed protein product [Linum tenue]